MLRYSPCVVPTEAVRAIRCSLRLELGNDAAAALHHVVVSFWGFLPLGGFAWRALPTPVWSQSFPSPILGLWGWPHDNVGGGRHTLLAYVLTEQSVICLVNVECRGTVYKAFCTWIWPSALCSAVLRWQQCFQYSAVLHRRKIWDKVTFHVDCFDCITAKCWRCLSVCVSVICLTPMEFIGICLHVHVSSLTFFQHRLSPSVTVLVKVFCILLVTNKRYYSVLHFSHLCVFFEVGIS